MYGIHTRFASAAISEGLGFDGDMVGQMQIVATNVRECLYTNVSVCMLFYRCLNACSNGSTEWACRESERTGAGIQLVSTPVGDKGSILPVPRACD